MSDQPTGPVTPAELRELAQRHTELAAEIAAVHQQLRAAPDEPTRLVGFRLNDAASRDRDVARELIATAEDLARIRGRSACGADWGVCPEHGATLRSTGGRSWCTYPGCGLSWDYDRCGLPCTEPPAFDVRDADGGGGPMCDGHARAAGQQLVDVRVTALRGLRG